MHRSRIFFSILVASLVSTGLGCEGAGPFAAGEGNDDPGFPGGPTSLTDTGQGEVTGSVEAADATQGSLTLAGDVDVRVTGQTDFDAEGEVTTLSQLLDALAAEAEVICEVRGRIEDGVLVAAELRCDTDAAAGGSSGGGSGSGSDGGPGSASRSTARIEGRVLSVDAEDGEFMIGGELKVKTDSETDFSGEGDLESLAAVEAAMSGGRTVEAEVRGEIEGGVIFASKVDFEFGDEEDDEQAADDEFEGIVSAVDLSGRFIVLDGRTRLHVASDALIDPEGDFRTLAEVDAAVELGIEVRAEAEAHLNAFGVLEATRIKFETDDEAFDDDPDEVEGVVASVNLLTRTVTTTDGRVIQIASDAIIDADGDLRTLAEVATALTLGIRVRVEARGTPSAGGLIASEVKFQVDD